MSNSIQTIHSGLLSGYRVGIDPKGSLCVKKVKTSRYCFLTKAARGETRREREALSLFKSSLQAGVAAATSDQLVEMGKSLKKRRLQVDKRLNGAFAFIRTLFRKIFMGCAEHRELKRLNEELKQVERLLCCTEKGFIARLNTRPTNVREKDFIKSNFSEFICSGTPTATQFTQGKRVLLEPWGCFYKLHMLTPSGHVHSQTAYNLADIGHAYGELLVSSKKDVFDGLRRLNYRLEDNLSYAFADSFSERSISRTHLCKPFSASKALDKVIIEFCGQTHSGSRLVNNVRNQYEGYAAVKLHYFDSRENLPKTKYLEISQSTDSEQLREQIADFAQENKAACKEEYRSIEKFAKETIGCSIDSIKEKFFVTSNDPAGSLFVGLRLSKGATYQIETPNISLKAVQACYDQLLKFEENNQFVKNISTAAKKKGVVIQLDEDSLAYKLVFRDQAYRFHEVVVSRWDEDSVETHYKAILKYLENEKTKQVNNQALSTVKAIGLPSLTALSHVRLDSLLTLFDSINFNDPAAKGYYDPLTLKGDGGRPITKAKLRENLVNLLKNIRLREPFEGIPTDAFARERFYAELTAILTHVIEHMQKETDPDLVTPHLISLAVGAGECGKRWKSESIEIYGYQRNISAIGENTPISDLIRHWFEEIKSEIVKELVSEREHETGNLPVQTPHIENYYLKVLNRKNIRCTLSDGMDVNDPCEETGQKANYGRGDAVYMAFLRKLSNLSERIHAKFKEHWNQRNADLIQILREHAESNLTADQVEELAKKLEVFDASLADWRNPAIAASLVGQKRADLLKAKDSDEQRRIHQLKDAQIIQNEINRLNMMRTITKNEYLEEWLTHQGLVNYDDMVIFAIDDITLKGVDVILQRERILESV